MASSIVCSNMRTFNKNSKIVSYSKKRSQMRCAASASKIVSSKKNIDPMLETNNRFLKSINELQFNNWAPEVINGRCAMLGMVSGIGYEMTTGTNILDQPYVWVSLWLSSLIITFASVYAGDPKLSLFHYNNKPFTHEAELLNGRVAMLGVMAYAISQIPIEFFMA